MSDHPLLPGDVISEYVLEEQVGSGGFGEVWRARHREIDGKRAAVKIATDATTIENLRREALLQHDLDHPNIVRTLGLDTRHTPPYFIMQWVDGESLQQNLNRCGTISARVAAGIALDVLAGLEFAHGRSPPVVHCDVKPSNILLGKDGFVRLSDFGLGMVQRRRTERDEISSVQRSGDGARPVAGTFDYMSPEQARGLPMDARSDLYSMGIVLHQMLTGQVRKLRFPIPGAHPGLSSLVERAVEEDPARRFRSAGDMRKALQDVMEKSPSLAPQPVDAPPSPRRAFLGKVLAILGGGMIGGISYLAFLKGIIPEVFLAFLWAVSLVGIGVGMVRSAQPRRLGPPGHPFDKS